MCTLPAVAGLYICAAFHDFRVQHNEEHLLQQQVNKIEKLIFLINCLKQDLCGQLESLASIDNGETEFF